MGVCCVVSYCSADIRCNYRTFYIMDDYVKYRRNTMGSIPFQLVLEVVRLLYPPAPTSPQFVNEWP